MNASCEIVDNSADLCNCNLKDSDIDIIDEYDRPAGVSYPRPSSHEGLQDVQEHDGYNEQDTEA